MCCYWVSKLLILSYMYSMLLYNVIWFSLHLSIYFNGICVLVGLYLYRFSIIIYCVYYILHHILYYIFIYIHYIKLLLYTFIVLYYTFLKICISYFDIYTCWFIRALHDVLYYTLFVSNKICPSLNYSHWFICAFIIRFSLYLSQWYMLVIFNQHILCLLYSTSHIV